MMIPLKSSRVRCFAVLALMGATALLAATSAKAADFKMYLKIDGIAGDVKDRGYEDTIEIVAYSWGASQSGSFNGGGSGAGKPSFQDISMTKYFDASTPPLLMAIAKGTILPKATLTLVRRVQGAADQFMIFAATNVMVSSLSTGGSIGQDAGTLSENFSFSFAQAKITYKDLDGTTSEVTVDVAGGTAH